MHEDGMGGRTLVVAAAAAFSTGLAGGVAWGLVVRLSGYEVGIVAWAIGFLVGTAVLAASGRRRGLPLQLLAVAGALVGILAGKYLAFAWVLQEAAADAGVELGLFSGEVREAFRDMLAEVFGWFDLLWIGLAVFSAWRLLEPEREPGGEAAA